MAEIIPSGADALWKAIGAAGPHPQAYLGSESQDSDEQVRAEHARRRSFIARFGYAVPTPTTIAAIAGFFEERRVLEVFAGLGLWASLLQDAGLSIVATDAALPQAEPYVPIELSEAPQAVDAHPECGGLLLIWPPRDVPAAHRALTRFAGDRLVVVGDHRFIADPPFHEELDRGWTLARKVPLPSWPGLNDEARLYRRS